MEYRITMIDGCPKEDVVESPESLSQDFGTNIFGFIAMDVLKHHAVLLDRQQDVLTGTEVVTDFY